MECSMKRPKFSIGSWAFSFGPFEENPWSFEEFLKYSADAGYDGIEINGFRPHPHPDDYDTTEKCQALKEKIESFGLGISGYAPDFRDVPPAEVPMSDYLDEIEKAIDFCIDMDIDVLRIDTISPPDELDEDEYNYRFEKLATTWHQAAEMCDIEDIMLVWEFEPGFWLNKPSEVLAIIEKVDHENFKVLFDTSHAYMCAVVGARQVGKKELLKGGVVAFANKLKGHIGHFHLIDSDGTLHDEETSTHAPFGDGHIDFVEVVSAMKEDVADLPWWCFDFCFCPTTEVDGRKAIPFVEDVLKNVN